MEDKYPKYEHLEAMNSLYDLENNEIQLETEKFKNHFKELKDADEKDLRRATMYFPKPKAETKQVQMTGKCFMKMQVQRARAEKEYGLTRASNKNSNIPHKFEKLAQAPNAFYIYKKRFLGGKDKLSLDIIGSTPDVTKDSDLTQIPNKYKRRCQSTQKYHTGFKESSKLFSKLYTYGPSRVHSPGVGGVHGAYIEEDSTDLDFLNRSRYSKIEENVIKKRFGSVQKQPRVVRSVLEVRENKEYMDGMVTPIPQNEGNSPNSHNSPNNYPKYKTCTNKLYPGQSVSQQKKSLAQQMKSQPSSPIPSRKLPQQKGPKKRNVRIINAILGECKKLKTSDLQHNAKLKFDLVLERYKYDKWLETDSIMKEIDGVNAPSLELHYKYEKNKCTEMKEEMVQVSKDYRNGIEHYIKLKGEGKEEENGIFGL